MSVSKCTRKFEAGDSLYIGFDGCSPAGSGPPNYGNMLIEPNIGTSFAYFGERMRSGGMGVRVDHIVAYYPTPNGTGIQLNMGYCYEELPIHTSDFEKFLKDANWVCPA